MFQKVIIALVVLFSAVVANVIPKIGNDSKKFSLYEIGEFGGKTFYAGKTEITWAEAMLDCQQHGYNSVDVQTIEERNFLNATLGALDEFSHYWVSAKQKFVWWSIDQIVSGDIGEIDDFGTNCLTIRIPDDPTPWDARGCEEVWPALCQSATK